MAVRKSKKEEVVEVVDTVVEDKVETEKVEEPKVEEPIVEVEIPEEKEEPKIEVDTSAVKVDKAKMPKSDVKIRMRKSHRCTIAMVRYDLVAGKTYNVPENVKIILDKAGLLAPL